MLRRNIADSFVNLGRRNQNLLGRQLDFITELESKEADPDTLASLFRLDHLATRMRRNAESLLVLAGIEPPRQWAAPVRVTDVVRAALGEVENYERVTVRGIDPATVQGSAAADLAHLLAELIENALVFSPPDQTVEIRGAAQRAGQSAGYTLAIMDSGLGMPPADIEAANRRLAGVESFTVAPSKYLGHYVAGNLAARHGIRVHLRSSPGTGIIASVELPPAILTPDTGTRPTPVGAPSDQRHLAPAPGPAASLSPGGQAHRARVEGTAGHAGPASPGRGSMAPTDDQWATLARLGGDGGGSRQAPAAPAPASPRPPAAGPPSQVRWQDIPGGGQPGAGPAPQPQPRPQPQPQFPTQSPPAAWPPAAQPAPRPAPQPAPQQPAPQQPAPQQAPRARRTATAGPTRPGRPDAHDQPPSHPRHTAGRARERPAGREPPVHRPRAADEVYGFLSSFTAGVQRGLDASRNGNGNGGGNEADGRR